MKENVTKFDLDAAFRALDEIEVPKVKGIRANRMDLKEATKRVDRLSMLVEDYYDVGDPAEMTQVGEERDGEVAKAKLARIEKIVDLDADSPEDLNPSYVGKDIIQCPQCMMLFYKNPEDIEASDGDPKTVNVGEVCQHCGNDSGYTLIGKVAAEDAPTEEIPAELPAENSEVPVEELPTEELPVEEIPAEEPATEEAPAEEPQLEEIPNEEAPAEEEEKKEESFTRPTGSSLQEQIENILAEENNAYDEPDDEEAEAIEKDRMEKLDILYSKKDSLSAEEFKKAMDDIYFGRPFNIKENLTESAESDLDKKLAEHNDYIATLQDEIKSEEEAIKNAKNEFIKKMHEDNLASLQAALDKAIPEEVKEVADTEVADATGADELPELEDVPAEAIENKEETPIETPKTESLHESLDRDLTEKIIGMFNDSLSTWDYETFMQAGAMDKEEIVKEVLQEFPEANEQEVYDLFWEWADNLTEDDFSDDLLEVDCTIHKAITHPDEDRKELNEEDKLPEVTDAAIDKMLDAPEFEKPVSDSEVEAYLNDDTSFDKAEDLHENLFNEHVTKFLNNVYKNVNCFETTDCTIKENRLIVEGLIKFNSGKEKNTSFTFTRTARNILEGYNKDFADDATFIVTFFPEDDGKLIITENIDYKFNTGKTLIEGFTR